MITGYYPDSSYFVSVLVFLILLILLIVLILHDVLDT